MKEFFSKTYRIGKLTISLTRGNIVFLYRGRKKIYLYNFNKNPLILINRKILLSLGVMFSVLMVGLFLLMSAPSDVEPVTDEEQKNRLILSEKTDYSAPQKSPSLIIRFHRIKKGETLSEIARDYGVSMDTICGNNKLLAYDVIRVGKVLKIPNKDGILHTVKSGQTVYSIALKYRVDVSKVLSENNMKNADFASVGDDIFIPDAKPLDLIPGFLWPTANRRISCGYGWRRNPFNKQRMEFHKGLDIRVRYGWVRAVKYGKITYTGWLGGYGKAILIAHPNGWKSLYGHLSRIGVRVGQYVKQGQHIARSGNTGLSTGPHLHFELIRRGRHLNPNKYLRR